VASNSVANSASGGYQSTGSVASNSVAMSSSG
jgi:hypothetical protein